MRPYHHHRLRLVTTSMNCFHSSIHGSRLNAGTRGWLNGAGASSRPKLTLAQARLLVLVDSAGKTKFLQQFHGEVDG